MSKLPKLDPLDKQILWINIIGLTVVAVLLGTFFTRYGADLVSFLAYLTGRTPWPDR
jgi:hypothetical protein